MQVERLAGGVVVVRVVHAAGDGGVVVAEDGERGDLADEVAALVGRGAVADGVAEADELVDAFVFESAEHRRQRLEVRVRVGEDADSHDRAIFDCKLNPASAARSTWV